MQFVLFLVPKFNNPYSSLIKHIQIFPYKPINNHFIYYNNKNNTFIIHYPLNFIYITSYQTYIPKSLYITTTTTTTTPIITQNTTKTTKPTPPTTTTTPITINPNPNPNTIQNPYTPKNIINNHIFFPYPNNNQTYIKYYNLPYITSIKLYPKHHY